MTLLHWMGLVWLALNLTGICLLAYFLMQTRHPLKTLQVRSHELSLRPVSGWMPMRFFLVVIAGVVLVGAAVSATHTWFPGPAEGTVTAALFWQVAILYTGVLLLVRVETATIPGGMRHLFGLDQSSASVGLGRGVGAYLIILPMFVATVLIYAGILHMLEIQMQPQPVMKALMELDSPIWIGLSFVFAVIAAPWVEELVFRGVLLPWLIRRGGLAAGLILTSLIFALVHGHAQTLVPLFMISVAFGCGYIWSGSLWIPVTMHACFNALNLVTGYLQHHAGGINL